MKHTLLHVRRLAVAAALLGVVFSPRIASAQSELDSSEAEAFMGDWTVALDTDFGAFDLDIIISDQDGKVAASVGSPEQGMSEVTDITRSGEDLVLSYAVDSPQGLFEISMVLTPDGDNLEAVVDFGGQLSASGTAMRTGN